MDYRIWRVQCRVIHPPAQSYLGGYSFFLPSAARELLSFSSKPVAMVPAPRLANSATVFRPETRCLKEVDILPLDGSLSRKTTRNKNGKKNIVRILKTFSPCMVVDKIPTEKIN